MRFLGVQNILDAWSSTRTLLSLSSSWTGRLSKRYMSRFFVLSSVNINLTRRDKFLRAVTWLAVHSNVPLHFHVKHWRWRKPLPPTCNYSFTTFLAWHQRRQFLEKHLPLQPWRPWTLQAYLADVLSTSELLSEKNGFTFIRPDMFLGPHPRRLVSAVSMNLQIVSSKTVHCCGIVVLGQKARSALAPEALRFIHLASDCRWICYGLCKSCFLHDILSSFQR